MNWILTPSREALNDPRNLRLARLYTMRILQPAHRVDMDQLMRRAPTLVWYMLGKPQRLNKTLPQSHKFSL